MMRTCTSSSCRLVGVVLGLRQCVDVKGNGSTQSGFVDVVLETSTEKLRIKKENPAISSATTKVISISATRGVPCVPLLRPYGANDMVKKQR